MEQQTQESTTSRFEDLKKVTPLSKYLAMILFIIMPFLGGWIGYTYAPEKIVETGKIVELVDKDSAKISNFLNSVNLCGKDFKVNDVYIDGVDVTQKLDQLLRNSLQSSTQEEIGSSCNEFLTNVSDSIFIKLTVTKVNYGFSEIVSANKFDAYAVQFIPNQEDSVIDVGFFIDNESYDVFRIVVYDGSKGAKVGKLE